MALCKTTVMKVYNHVIDDVIAGVRDIFTDEGLDEHVLIELRSLWETKLHNSRAVEAANENQDVKVAKKQEGIPIQNSVVFNHGVKREGFNTVKKDAAQHQFLKNEGQTQSNIPAPQPQNPEDKIIPIQITLPIQPSVDAVTRVLTIHVPASALNGQQLHSLLTGPIITATMGLPAPLASSLLQEHVNAALSQQQQQLTVNKIVMPQMDGSVDIEDTCETNKNAFTTEIPVQLSSCMLQEEQLPENKVDEHAHTSQSSSGSVLPKKARGRTSKSKKKEIIFEIIRRPLDGGTDTSDDDDDVSEDDVSDDDIDEEKEDEDAELDEGGPEEEPLNSEDDVTDEEPSDLFDTDNVVVCQYDKITRSRNKWKFYLKDGIMNLDGEDFVFQKANGDAEW